MAANGYAEAKNGPVGLILSAETPTGKPGAQAPQMPGLLHASRPEVAAAGGDLLFPGDRLRAHAGSVTFVFCPAGQMPARQVLGAGGEAILERDKIVSSAKGIRNRDALGFCQLPAVDPEPEISSKGAQDPALRVADSAAYTQRIAGLNEPARRQITALDAALRANPQDMVAMTSRAVLLERNGLAPEAADQYAAIANIWKGQQWAKMLVQTERRAAAPAIIGPRTTYAVIIGISDYGDPSINLHYAHLDAQRFKDYLLSDRGHQVPADHIRLLKDSEATLPAIKNSINFLVARAGRNDTVIFFISAHGAVSEGEGYLIPYGVNLSNLGDSAYPMSSLFALMYEMGGKVGRFVMYVDACRAGNIGQITEKNLINPKIAQAVRDNADNIMALLASKGQEPAWEHSNFGLGEGHSAFTYFLLRGLAADGIREADMDNDGTVSLGELFQYVQNQVIKATLRRQHPTEFSKFPDDEKEVMADITEPGIKINGWQPMPPEAFLNKNLSKELFPPPTEDKSPPPNDTDLDRLIRIEEQGQQIMLQYLEGDEIPQTRDEFERGRQVYEQALALAPGSLYLESRKEFFQGRTFIFDKQYDDAIAHLETAIRLNPRSASPYNALGIAYLEQGRYAEAVAAFESAIGRASYWAYPRHNLALTYMQMGRNEPAILAYQKAMQLAPPYSYLPYNLGLIYEKMNRFREAESAFRQARQLADARAQPPVPPQLAEAYAERRAAPVIALALLKANDRRTSEAISDYNEALAILAPYAPNKNILIARHDLALLLARKKESWTEAGRLLTENIAAGYIPSQQFMAEWLAERGEPAAAVPRFEALLLAEPKYTAARLELAAQLDKLGDAAREREQLQLARQNDPENVAVLLALARFETAQENSDRAREAYRAALDHTSDPQTIKQIRAALKRLP